MHSTVLGFTNAEKEKPQGSCFGDAHSGICKSSQFNVITALRDSAAVCSENNKEISWRKSTSDGSRSWVWSMLCSLKQLITHVSLWVLSFPVYKIGP